jgi:hypothetical protein
MLEGDTLRLCKLTSCVSSVISYVPTLVANHRIKDGILFVPDFFGYPDGFAKTRLRHTRSLLDPLHHPTQLSDPLLFPWTSASADTRGRIKVSRSD